MIVEQFLLREKGLELYWSEN